MAAVIRHTRYLSSQTRKRIAIDRTMLAALVVWGALGPLVFILYENHINAAEWNQIAALPATQAEDIRVAYYAAAIVHFLWGMLIWVAGLAVLALSSLHHHRD